MSFIRTGLREIGLKVRRQRSRMALRHEKRLLQRSEVSLGREGCSQAVNFPEVRDEIVALKKLEQEQKEVAMQISQVEEGVKQIEAQRQQNAKEQATELAKLEAEKKPILERRNQAKATADLCDRELAGVERRLQGNDDADRELLQKLSELQAQAPPPADLETRAASLSSQRARLPEERTQISTARIGSARACREAREKLTAEDAALDTIEKNIARVRAEFEARDRALNENSRAQQELLREAQAKHQTVEERKNPAYLNIGRHLASQGIAPPNAPHLLSDVQRRRSSVDRHSQHKAELAVLSKQIDKQELRKFYFSVVSVLVLLAIILPLVFQTPAKREWLPQETETIFSLNTGQFEREELPRRWRKEQPEEWRNVWTGLTSNAERTPALNISNDAARVTRAITTDHSGGTREFVLLEARADLSNVVNSIQQDHAFVRRSVNGLGVWTRDSFAVARVGPKTLAIGSAPEVDELVRVRLGIAPDLKISGQLFDRFQALNKDTALRLISRDPQHLPNAFHPIFSRELLGEVQMVGLALNLQNPPKAKLTLKAKTEDAASALERNLRSDPQHWLRLQDSDLFFFAQSPELTRQGADLELRGVVPENSARLLLQRFAKTDSAKLAVAR